MATPEPHHRNERANLRPVETVRPAPRYRGRYYLANWIWLLMILAIVGALIWAWGFNGWSSGHNSF